MNCKIPKKTTILYLANLNYRDINFSPFFRIKFLLPPEKHNTRRNKIGFILNACDYPPLNSRVKNKTSFEFLFYVVFYCVNQNIKQNIGENIKQCWFYETSITILRD